MINLLFLAASLASAITGPVDATVIGVHDGDTLTVQAHPWPGQYIETPVRVRGIDAPELKGKCQAEIDLAQKARDMTAALVKTRVTLTNIAPDKFGGRIDATVILDDGTLLADHLQAASLARPYTGGPRKGWCQ
jgi:micrococcal nuclease